MDCASVDKITQGQCGLWLTPMHFLAAIKRPRYVTVSMYVYFLDANSAALLFMVHQFLSKFYFVIFYYQCIVLNHLITMFSL
jgi:hypothetical protein